MVFSIMEFVELVLRNLLTNKKISMVSGIKEFNQKSISKYGFFFKGYKSLIHVRNILEED